MDHSKCMLISGICGSITAGQGKLSENGYFEIPCDECASRAEEYWYREPEDSADSINGSQGS